MDTHHCSIKVKQGGGGGEIHYIVCLFKKKGERGIDGRVVSKKL